MRDKGMKVFRLPLLAGVFSIVATLVPIAAGAQEYPVKPVRMVVPFPAGGPNDLAVRPLTQKLTELLGQQFIVDNRAGANGVIGTEYVVRSPPDGYTLLIISSSYTINTLGWPPIMLTGARSRIMSIGICR